MLVTIVVEIPSPTAPPHTWSMYRIPEARPARDSSSDEIAAVTAELKNRPFPSPSTSIPGTSTP